MNNRLLYTSLKAHYSKPEDQKFHEDVCNYLIDVNYITMLDKGCDDPICRQKLISFLGDKGSFWKKIEAEWGNICSLPIPEKMIFNTELISRFQSDFYFKEKQKKLHLVFAEGIMLDLNEPYTLDPNEFIDRDYFDFFFAYRLAKRDVAQLRDFLGFNFAYSFNGDLDKFIHFITQVVLVKYEELIGSQKVNLIKQSLSSSQINLKDISPTVVAYMVMFIEMSDRNVNKEELYRNYQQQYRPDDIEWAKTIKTSYSRLDSSKPDPKHKAKIKLAIELLGYNNRQAVLMGQKVLKLIQ